MRITNTTYRPQNYDYSKKANSSFAVYIGKDDRLKSFLLRVTIQSALDSKAVWFCVASS